MVIETAPRRTAPLVLMQPPDTLKCDLPSGRTDLMSQGCSQSCSRLHCEVRWCLALAGGQWLTRFTRSGSTFFPKARQMFFVDCRQPCDAKNGDFFFGSPLEVGDVEQSLADYFPKCEGCCVCQCGSATVPIVILVITVVERKITLFLVISCQITLHVVGSQKIVNFYITRFGLCRFFFTLHDSASFVVMCETMCGETKRIQPQRCRSTTHSHRQTLQHQKQQPHSTPHRHTQQLVALPCGGLVAWMIGCEVVCVKCVVLHASFPVLRCFSCVLRNGVWCTWFFTLF